MHEIDLMLKLQLEGKHEEARVLSDKLENIGPDKILDPNGKNTQDIWMRHCFNRGWFMLQKGYLSKGHKLLDRGREISVFGNTKPNTNKPIWDGKSKGTVLLYLEGGLGDQVWISSILLTCTTCCLHLNLIRQHKLFNHHHSNYHQHYLFNHH